MSQLDAPLLEIEDLAVEYQEEPLTNQVLPDQLVDRLGLTIPPLRAVDGVSLELGENDVVAIVGESGCGKSTLGKAAIGIGEEPISGSVRYRGTDVWDSKRGEATEMFFEDIRQSLQIVHQDPGAALNPYRSIRSSLTQPLKRWFPELTAPDRRERILRLLDESGLTPAQDFIDRYPHELSGGEKQRVVLLRAMMSEPDVIFADEPVSALDNSLRVELLDLMLELQDLFETSYLFISHNLEHARYITKKAGGRIAIMYLGKIVEQGPIDEVIEDPQHPYTQVLKWATLPTNPRVAREAVSQDIPLRSMDVPDLIDRPTGCQFHTRCPKAREACISEEPALVDGGSDREVACFRAEENHPYWNSEPLEEEEEDRIIPI